MKLVMLTLALSFACAAAEEPEDGGPRSPSGGSGVIPGGTGSLGGSGTSTAGKPSGTGGTGTGTSGTGTGATSSVGGTPTGTAGTATGTAGTATGTAGTGATSCPPYTGTLATDSVIFSAGFGTSTAGTPKWSGYGYTYKYGTATITPGMGNSCFAGMKFCASGSVPASDASGAGLGWNISQAQGASTMSKVPVTAPVKISFAGFTDGMRVQLSASTTVSYCYALTPAEVAAKTATIPLASFKTECWGTTGTAYDGVVPIEAIQVAVPGSTAGAAKTFDFCVLDIEPG